MSCLLTQSSVHSVSYSDHHVLQHSSMDHSKNLRDSGLYHCDHCAGMMDCKTALMESGGDMAAAQEFLRKKGLASAEKKAGRIAAEGAIVSYIHAGAQLGVIAEVNCETDFVARGDKFKEFALDVAMQVLNPCSLCCMCCECTEKDTLAYASQIRKMGFVKTTVCFLRFLEEWLAVSAGSSWALQRSKWQDAGSI